MHSFVPVIAVDTTEMIDAAYDFVAAKGVDFGINVVAAIAIFFIGKWIAGILTRITGRLMVRAKVDETLIKFAGNLVNAALMIFVILAAVDRLGINTTSFAAVIAAAGLAVGLALQGSLSNFSSGVMLILFKPFRAGDFVEAGGSTGVIEEIHIFNTIMRTGDNVQIIIPNSAITDATITNFSAKTTRRIDLVIGCGYGDDLKAVKQYLEVLLDAEDRILQDPAPVVAVSELGDSSVNFVVRPWVNSADYWDVRWDLTERIKLDFDAKGFNFPFPSQDVYMHNAG